MKNTLKFSTNWNNKLDCKYYTTIRLAGKKFEISKAFDVELKNQPHHVAKVIDMVYVKLDNLNAYNCYLDTGYDVATTKEIFKKMYPAIDFATTYLVIILLEKL